MNISYEELVKSQPPEYSREINMHGACLENTFVVLDDGPTGCQTVHDVPVLFSWEKELLTALLEDQVHLFFILTNTRSMNRTRAMKVIGQVMKNLTEAGRKAGRSFTVISRGESALRGHYPDELNAIAERLEGDNYMHCLIPTFFPGGRYTCNDIHYVKEGDELIPVAETPLAGDSSFGYSHSDLPGYIEEKTGGEIPSSGVLSFSVEELRKGGPDYVREKLRSSDLRACIVNAMAQSDLDVFAAGAWEAILTGKKILFRTGSSFINSFGCIPVKEPLDRSSLRNTTGEGGLIVVGSYADKTSRQILPLVESANIIPMELHVQELLAGLEKEIITSFAQRAEKLISMGRHALIYTSRDLIASDDPKRSLEIKKAVSEAMVAIVKELKTTPAFLVVKGSSTAQNIASKAFGFKQTTVIGRALPGVPVFVTADRPGMKFVIFPGNLGEKGDLMRLFRLLSD